MQRSTIAVLGTAFLTIVAAAAGVAVGGAMPIWSGAPAATSAPAERGAVSVLGPIGYGQSAPVADAERVPASPVVGTVDLPLDSEGRPDLAADLLEDAQQATATEAVWDFPVVDEGAGSDDACAPRTGEPAADCPDGIHGAIFAHDAVALWIRATPAFHEPSDALPPYAVQCAHEETADDAIQFGFAISRPGTVTMTYGIVDLDEIVTIRLDPTAAQIADWESRLAAATPDDHQPTIFLCTILAELQPYVAYEYTATLTDEHGATAEVSGRFGLPEDRVRPPAVIRPVGPGALFTALAHQPEDRVQITYHVLDPGETPDCTAASDDLPTPTGRDYAVAVPPLTEAYLADHGWLPGYTERTAWLTAVPEGSTVLVCFSELQSDRPTWEWLEAQWRTWAVVQTPDFARPTVMADSVSLVDRVDADAIKVTIDWGMGSCELVSGPSRAGGTLTPSGSSCDGGPHAPTQVDPVVQIAVTHKGEVHRSSAVLPLGSMGATGGITVPETSWFSVPLTVEVDEVEMCGSGVRAPCSRIEGYGTAGTVLLRVDWTQGASNGRTDWHIGETHAERIAHELAATPQVDYLGHDFEIVAPSERGGPVQVRYLLETDRPVDYEVRLAGECVIDGEEMTLTGHSSGVVSLRWQACPGETYALTGTLTDADGNVGTDFGAPYSTVTLPGYDTRLAVAYRVEHTGAAAWEGPNVLLASLELRLDGQPVDLDIEPGHCLERAVYDRSAGVGLREVELSSTVRVDLRVLMVESWGGYGGGEPPTCSGGSTWGVPTVDLVAEVPLADLLEGVTVSWGDDSDYAVALTLQDYGPAS